MTMAQNFPRADRAALAAFDPATKVCTMNCGPSIDDPRSPEERKFLCNDCNTVVPPAITTESGPHPNTLKAAQTERVIYPKRDRLPDDERKALDAMVSAMSEKLYRKYIEGYSGFEGASEEHLNRLLHEHLPKGDPVDVANFCAFLLHNGQRVRLSPERVSVPISDERIHELATMHDLEPLDTDFAEHDWAAIRAFARALLAAAQEGK